MLTAEKVIQRQLDAWFKLRQNLETSEDPFLDVSKFFLKLPKVKFYTDPYDSGTWPTPWELVSENEYCEFNLILGMCYTLQLTDRFKHIQPKIHIAVDNNSKTVYYLLLIEDKVYGYNEGWSTITELPKSLKIQKIYNMKPLH
jgi:hypothetical protein